MMKWFSPKLAFTWMARAWGTADSARLAPPGEDEDSAAAGGRRTGSAGPTGPRTSADSKSMLIQHLPAEVRQGGERFPAPLPRFCYWSSFNTLCCIWLACASEEMPVWFRIEYLVMLATSCAMSAARMPSSAADRFCVWLLITATALCSRFMAAPRLPRRVAMLAMAWLMSVRAAWALAAEVRSSAEMSSAVVPSPTSLLPSAPVVAEIVPDPVAVESVR